MKKNISVIIVVTVVFTLCSAAFAAKSPFECYVEVSSPGTLLASLNAALSGNKINLESLQTLHISGTLNQQDLEDLGSVEPLRKTLQTLDMANANAKGLKLPYAFMQGAGALAEFKFPKGISELGGYALYGCANLYLPKLPSTVSVIGEFSLARCLRLGIQSLPSGLKSIRRSAFSGSFIGRKTLVLPKGLEYFDQGAFARAKTLEAIYIDPASKYFITRDGVLYNKSNGLLFYPPQKTDKVFAVPEGTVAIRDSAVSNLFLKSVIIPESMAYIEPYAFADSENLSAVYFKGNVPTNMLRINPFEFTAYDFVLYYPLEHEAMWKAYCKYYNLRCEVIQGEMNTGESAYPSPLCTALADMKLMADASSSAKQTATIKKGDTFTMLGYERSEKWLKVKLESGKTGYIQAGSIHMKFNRAMQGTMKQKATVYSLPKAQNAYKIMDFNKGEEIDFFGRSGSFLMVSIDMQTGYVPVGAVTVNLN